MKNPEEKSSVFLFVGSVVSSFLARSEAKVSSFDGWLGRFIVGCSGYPLLDPSAAFA